MRRARLNVRPNISIKGGRGAAPLVKPEVTASELVTGSDQEKEQLVVSSEPQAPEKLVEEDAVQLIIAKTEAKCSPQKHDTPRGSITSTANFVRRRSRIKPPVLVTRNRTCTADVTSIQEDKRVSWNDAGGRLSSVPEDHNVAAPPQESKEKTDETDASHSAQPLKEAEDGLNVGAVKVCPVDSEKLPDLVEVVPATADEPKPLMSPSAGKAVGAVRRSHFPKAKPNLIDTGRHGRIRHPSQSDAEEEAGKIQGPPSVQRLASLSPANARLLAVSPDTRCSEVFVPPGCSNNSPIKPCSSKEDIVVETALPEETLNKTLMSKTEKKQVLRRKRRKMEMLAGEVDRSKLTMRDLIYMNPVDNPMKSTVEEAERRRKIKTEEKVRRQDGDNPEEEKSDDVQVADSDKDDDDDVITLEDETQSVAGSEKCDVAETAETKGDEEELVPQVTIGPDGNIVINQASLTIETNTTKGKEQEDWDIVTEEFSSTSLAYGRKPPSRLWKLNETKKFYVALSTVGTDFSLMSNLFPKRSRVELKRKFKREEKQNKHLVETALKERRGFDVTLFDELSSEEEEEIVKGKKKTTKRKGKNEKENQEVQKRKKSKDGGHAHKKRKTKTRSKYYDDSSSSESEEEDSMCDAPSLDKNRPAMDGVDDGHATIARLESPHPSDEDEAGILKSMCRTTRYGRKPRPIKTYEAATTPASRRRRSSSKPMENVAVASSSQFSSPPQGGVAAPPVLMSPGRGMFARSPSGQLISLANLGQSSPVTDMASSQFVFVTSPPRQNADGSVSTSPQVIHVYLVSNVNAAPSGGEQQVLPSIEASSETTSGLKTISRDITDDTQGVMYNKICRTPGTNSLSSTDGHVMGHVTDVT